MLSDTPRQKLAAMIALDGIKVASDAKLCEALLRDYCGEYRVEIAALTAAVRWGIPKSLNQPGMIPPATLRANLARRLQENHGLAEESAFWAVDAWSSVLIQVANGTLSPAEAGSDLAGETDETRPMPPLPAVSPAQPPQAQPPYQPPAPPRQSANPVYHPPSPTLPPLPKPPSEPQATPPPRPAYQPQSPPLQSLPPQMSVPQSMAPAKPYQPPPLPQAVKPSYQPPSPTLPPLPKPPSTPHTAPPPRPPAYQPQSPTLPPLPSNPSQAPPRPAPSVYQPPPPPVQTPAFRPAPSIPQPQPVPTPPPPTFLAAAQAFESRQTTAPLIQVQTYLKTEIKTRNSMGLMGELQNAGVQPLTAKRMVKQAMRPHAVGQIGIAVGVFVASLVVIGMSASLHLGIDEISYILCGLSVLYLVYRGIRLIETF